MFHVYSNFDSLKSPYYKDIGAFETMIKCAAGTNEFEFICGLINLEQHKTHPTLEAAQEVAEAMLRGVEGANVVGQLGFRTIPVRKRVFWLFEKTVWRNHFFVTKPSDSCSDSLDEPFKARDVKMPTFPPSPAQPVQSSVPKTLPLAINPPEPLSDRWMEKFQIYFVSAASLSIVMLLATPLQLPYFYYVLLRWIVCPTCVAAAFAVFAYGEQRVGARQIFDPELMDALFMWVFVAFAAVFNPIIPFHMSRSVWFCFDILTAVLFIALLLRMHRMPKRSGIVK